ncbi:arginine N-succinyltransferase [Paucibacter sp. KCTC 42545]|uniref:arginine N-succinyltransferase n=1 Tax=Paucibacter sp. KCTC 42545 TaxID=1768242 RepID=UPI0009EA0519|nr:arginine N-succinyltransferase [Paucibacter sp. KCTC 42545]
MMSNAATDPRSLMLRPVALADLPALERIAAASEHGISSLPNDSAKLRLRIERSLEAFASMDDASGEETYLFVLEDRACGEVVGTSGIAASAGFHDRFYSYRNEFVVHASAQLGVSRRLHTLHLCHDLTGYTLLTSFYIAPDYSSGLAPQLLSRARLLFILLFAERFNDRIAAESPGLADAAGQSPFWDAVGRRFFAMDYPQAEAVTGGRSKAFIADLMPHSPIYVPLLPEAAQWAIGQLHPVGELPFSILQDEGFDADTYIDIFDGGPTVEASLGLLRTVKHARQLSLQADGVAPGLPDWHLVVTGERASFRAVLAEIAQTAHGLPPGHELLGRLGLSEDAGARLLVSPLQPSALELERV